MDLASFSDDNFESVKWINEFFDKNKNSDKEKLASDVVIKLQSFIQEINKSLEDFSKNIIVNLSKVNKEIILITDEAFKLKNNLDQVQSEINRLQIENNAPFMEKLIKMNLIKNRMQSTCNSLKEADNWTNLSKEIENLFDLGDIDAIANKLLSMQKSLELLTDIPDYVDRIVKLNSLKKKFEVLLIPKINLLLNSSFQNLQSNTSQESNTILTKYFQYFKDLDKLDSLKQVYHDSLCHLMILEWQKIKDYDNKENILDWLSNYIDYLISMWNNQNKIIINLIVDNPSYDFLIELYIDLFKKLNDDFIKFLSDNFKNKEENCNNCINLMIIVKTTLDRLVKNIDCSIENDKLDDKTCLLLTDLYILIYSSYKKLLQIYINIEGKFLENDFLRICSSYQLNELVVKFFYNLCESEKRIHSLSKSVLMPRFFIFIDKYFTDCLNYLDKLFEDFENKVNMNVNSIMIPDWDLFQKAIFYLQIIGEFNLQFECFQLRIFNSLLDLKVNLSKSKKISQKYNILFLNESDQFNFNQLNLSTSDQLFKLNYKKLCQLCQKNSKMVYLIAINYIKKYLDQMNVCFKKTAQLEQRININEQQSKEDEILKLSLTPNEYITQIGQYLLTLPQHIEPFINQENIALKSAFGHFYLQQQEEIKENLEFNNLAEYFLNLLIHQTAHEYVKRIKQFNFQNNHDKFQLITDIEYINEVIEDLGFTSNNYLNEILSNFS